MKSLNAIIRKPQEGKTFICLESVNRAPEKIHLIVTMNTIKSNLQFFQRASVKFDKNNICIFNSRYVRKDERKEYNHTDNLKDLEKYISTGIRIVIMCAHYKRFYESILGLLPKLEKYKKQVVIHIDEAHTYVPSYRKQVSEMNSYAFVEKLYLYSATPFKILDSSRKSEELFRSLYIVDIESEFGIKRSSDYFGVKNCNIIHIERENRINPKIDKRLLDKWGETVKNPNWYGVDFPFLLGNEKKFMGYINYILTHLKTTIKQDEFSYNFIPAYVRKVTHYGIMENILKEYVKAIVIIVNGNGTKGYYNKNGKIKEETITHNNEPSIQIENYVKGKKCPVFVTGFHCVGMSVTLINENLGNFDNVIISHEHYRNLPDVLYQLCRFVFNYINWKRRDKIKKTNIYCRYKRCVDICLNYERQIEIIEETMKGTIVDKKMLMGDNF